MALDEEKIKNITDDLDEKNINLKWVLGIEEKRVDNFLKVKLAFASFVGVIFTIIFANLGLFSQKFILIFSIITFAAFSLLIYDLWESFIDAGKALIKQGKRVTLAQIRHVAAIENNTEFKEKFTEYARAAEAQLQKEHRITQLMKKDTPLEKIIDDQKITSNRWIFNFLLWAVLFLSVPVLIAGNIISGKKLSQPIVASCNVRGIKLYGQLMTYIPANATSDPNTSGDFASSDDIVRAINEANASSSIKGIILNVDSPGGQGVAGQEIASALKASSKTTVGWVRVAADSAAYWAISGAQHIVAADISDVGSIGVTMSYTDNAKKDQQDGVTFHKLSVGKYKDTGNPDKSLTAEEQKLFNDTLQIDYNQFMTAIAENRHMDMGQVKVLADGAPRVGLIALDKGLIDQIGGLPEAKQYIKDKTGEKDIRICW